jgi:hypothetical protein
MQDSPTVLASLLVAFNVKSVYITIGWDWFVRHNSVCAHCVIELAFDAHQL